MSTGEKRLESLDALRGIAAFGVVIWHYQHFGGDAKSYPYLTTPIIDWLYLRGWIFVDFFFLLSGIVFTYKYLEPVSAGAIKAREFFILRVSRIYPLHVLTLVVCAAIQWWWIAHSQPAFLYQQNHDLYHFALNLFFLQAGWFDSGYQYNAPSWSVGVEVFVYLLFFKVASLPRERYLGAAIGLVLLGMSVYRVQWTYPVFNEFIARAVTGFFLGSLIYLGLKRVIGTPREKVVGLTCLAALLCIALMVRVIPYNTFVGGSGLRIVPGHIFVIFPLVIAAALTLSPIRWFMSLRPLRFLGDISFTLYMLHVPIQLVIMSHRRATGAALDPSNLTFFWTYVASLFIGSALCHRFFEVPVRRWLRIRFMGPGRSGARDG